MDFVSSIRRMPRVLYMVTLLVSFLPASFLVAGSRSREQAPNFSEPEHHPFVVPVADISFVVLDLKYNAQDGVKICEMQSGRESQYSGYDFLTGGNGFVPDQFYNIVSTYQRKGWWVDGDFNDTNLVKKLGDVGWKKIPHLDQLQSDSEFLRLSSMPVENPSDLGDYHGVVYAHDHRFMDLSAFKRQYPGIIVLDAAFMPYFKNKGTMDRLLESSPKLSALRPRFKLCPKHYTKKLAIEILAAIDSDLLVIKPIHTAEGYGVIIIERGRLDSTLKYILSKENKKNLCVHNDKSYSHWALDNEDFFLVEEFISSELVQVPHFDYALYDGTMRVVLMLVYHLGKLDVHMIEGHWKLPEKSTSEVCSLMEMHKSNAKVPYFHAVDESILQRVRQQLTEGFEELYQQRTAL